MSSADQFHRIKMPLSSAARLSAILFLIPVHGTESCWDLALEGLHGAAAPIDQSDALQRTEPVHWLGDMMWPSCMRPSRCGRCQSCGARLSSNILLHTGMLEVIREADIPWEMGFGTVSFRGLQFHAVPLQADHAQVGGSKASRFMGICLITHVCRVRHQQMDPRRWALVKRTPW